jgi:ArsR family transcriptional regulator
MHPVRLSILNLLRDGEQCVCHLIAVLGYRQAYISQQLSVLRDLGIVEIKREGVNIYYRIVLPQILAVMDLACEIAGNHVDLEIAKPALCNCPKCRCVNHNQGVFRDTEKNENHLLPNIKS